MRQYAIQGYDVDAADFIVKPVNYPEFALKFTRLLGKVERPEAVSPDVFIKTENSFVRLAPSDIFYVEVKGHYCVYHTASGEYRRYQTLKNAEASPPLPLFCPVQQFSSGQSGARSPESTE